MGGLSLRGPWAVSGVVLLLWWRQQSHTKAQEYANNRQVRAPSQSRHMSPMSTTIIALSSGVEVGFSRHFCFFLKIAPSCPNFKWSLITKETAAAKAALSISHHISPCISGKMYVGDPQPWCKPTTSDLVNFYSGRINAVPLLEVHSVDSSLRAPETMACPVAFSFNRIKENAM